MIVSLIVVLVLLGLLLWALEQFPLDATIKTIIKVVAVVVAVLYVLQAFGLFHSGLTLK